jgi:type II secretory pathway pseudopilin PulG
MPVPHPSFPSGFTRREVLFALGVLLLFAVFLAGPVSHYLAQSRRAQALQKARDLNLLLSQYATDNDDTYPVGQGTTAPGTSEGIARNLLDDRYATTPDLFALGRARAYSGTAPDFSDFAADQIDWDFTAGATATTGLTADAPGLLPTLYSTGEIVTYPIGPSVGLDLPLSGAGPFGRTGVIVADKDGSAAFLPAAEGVARGFIRPGFDGAGRYTQLRP